MSQEISALILRLESALNYIIKNIPERYLFDVEGIDPINNIVKLKFKGNISYLTLASGDFMKLSDEAFLGLISHEIAHLSSPSGSENHKAYFDKLGIMRELSKTQKNHHITRQQLEAELSKLEKDSDTKEGEAEYNRIEDEANDLAISWGFDKAIAAIMIERELYNTIAELKKDD